MLRGSSRLCSGTPSRQTFSPSILKEIDVVAALGMGFFLPVDQNDVRFELVVASRRDVAESPALSLDLHSLGNVDSRHVLHLGIT